MLVKRTWHAIQVASGRHVLLPVLLSAIGERTTGAQSIAEVCRVETAVRNADGTGSLQESHARLLRTHIALRRAF